MYIGELSPKGRELREIALTFMRDEVWPFETEMAQLDDIDRARHQELKWKARRLGLQNINMPEETGGHNLGVLDIVAIEEVAGMATMGLGFLVSGRGPRAFYENATPVQMERYVVPMMQGELRSAWAVTEPGSGSDFRALQSTAVRNGDDWVINGEKWFVTGGHAADFFYVLANTEEYGQTLFLVDRDNPGVHVIRTPKFMHDPYVSKHLEMRFVDCRVPDDNRMEGQGDESTRDWFSDERLLIAARCCGAAERLINLASEWAQERQAFGGPIAEYQGVQFPLADSVTELAAARMLTWHAATAADRKIDRKVLHGKIAMAKLYASEMANRVADRSLQIFGGRGYMVENAAERYFREVRVDRIWEGTSEIQRVVIARGLFKRGLDVHIN